VLLGYSVSLQLAPVSCDLRFIVADAYSGKMNKFTEKSIRDNGVSGSSAGYCYNIN
jgi:hypothetical protein